MSPDRKEQLFKDMVNYIESLDFEQSVEALCDIGVTSKEAEELGFSEAHIEELKHCTGETDYEEVDDDIEVDLDDF